MAIKSRVSQDRRNTSRLIAQLECNLKHKKKGYSAVIVDLSSKGALISSSFVPALNDLIEITVQSKHLKRDLNLSGQVLRSADAMTEHGKRGRFVVRFHESPLDLTLLIGKIYSAK